MEKGAKFEFKEYELNKALQVLGWSFGSAIVAFLIAVVGATDVPPQYTFLVPVVNTLLYMLKEYVADNRGVVE